MLVCSIIYSLLTNTQKDLLFIFIILGTNFVYEKYSESYKQLLILTKKLRIYSIADAV